MADEAPGRKWTESPATPLEDIRRAMMLNASPDESAIVRELCKRAEIDVEKLPRDSRRAAEEIQMRFERRVVLFLYSDGWDRSRGRTPEPMAMVMPTDFYREPHAPWLAVVPIPGGSPEDVEHCLFDTLDKAMAAAQELAEALAAIPGIDPREGA